MPKYLSSHHPVKSPLVRKAFGKPLDFRQLAVSFESSMKVPFCRSDNSLLQQNLPSVIFSFWNRRGSVLLSVESIWSHSPFPPLQFLAGKKKRAHELSLSCSRTVVWWVGFGLIQFNTSSRMCQTSFFPHGSDFILIIGSTHVLYKGNH